jgi:hypothetical protein
MSTGWLPAGLLCGAFGLALARAPRHAAIPGLLALAAAAATAAWVVPSAWRDRATFVGWLVAAVAAALVHRRAGLSALAAFALAVLAGGCAGATAAAPLPALLCAPAALLAARTIARRVPLALGVAASWLIAVAMLAAVLALLPVTPGNLPDHLE